MVQVLKDMHGVQKYNPGQAGCCNAGSSHITSSHVSRGSKNAANGPTELVTGIFKTSNRLILAIIVDNLLLSLRSRPRLWANPRCLAQTCKLWCQHPAKPLLYSREKKFWLRIEIIVITESMSGTGGLENMFASLSWISWPLHLNKCLKRRDECATGHSNDTATSNPIIQTWGSLGCGEVRWVSPWTAHPQSRRTCNSQPVHEDHQKHGINQKPHKSTLWGFDWIWLVHSLGFWFIVDYTSKIRKIQFLRRFFQHCPVVGDLTTILRAAHHWKYSEDSSSHDVDRLSSPRQVLTPPFGRRCTIGCCNYTPVVYTYIHIYIILMALYVI